MITRNFILHLTAGLASPLVINVNQYDQGEQWLFTLYNQDGTQYVPSSGAIVGIKSDNLGIINSGTVDSQGRVVINETQQMTAAVGKAVFELVIDDGTHGTANFVVLVEAKPGDNADLSETDISMIEQAIEAASTIKPYGSPLVASTVAGMTDHDKVYVYVGSETGYTSGNWYYWDGSAWTSGGVYNSVAVQTDTTLALSGVAADAKKTGDEISDLKSQITNGVPRAVKLAMDAMFANMAVENDDVYSDEYAIIHAWATAVNVVSISASFDQGDNLIFSTDDIDSLKQYLTVTATYDDETTSTLSDSAYALSGTLADGTSVITVSYDGKTTSFNASVIGAEEVTVDWENPPGVTANTLYSYNSATGALRVYRTATTATFQQIRYILPMLDGYTYLFKFHAERTLGVIGGCYENSNGGIYTGTGQGWTTTSGDYQSEIAMIPNESTDTSVLLCFFCTGATKEKGDVTYSNLKLIKYQTPQGA